MGNCFSFKKNSSGYDSDEKIDFKSGNVHVITSKEDWDQKISEANKDGKIVVANFSASWCGPCRMIAPLYGELSENLMSLEMWNLFEAVLGPQEAIFCFSTFWSSQWAIGADYSDGTSQFCQEFSSSWDIRATPTFFFLRGGQQVDKLVGANKPELQKKVATFADSSYQCP